VRASSLWPPMTPFQLSVLLFLQLAVILASCRAAGWIGRRLGQPQVVCEMIAGVILGPSVLGFFSQHAATAGWISSDWQARLFPTASKPILFAICQVGLALYMFLVGVEFRTDLFKSRARAAASVSLAGMLVPFVLGGGLGWWLFRQGGFFSGQASWHEAVLFLGAAMCITAFPMLARIIYERGLSGTALGTLSLAAGAIDDATAWAVLAIVLASFSGQWSVAITAIGGGAIYALVVLTLGRRWLAPLGPMTERAGGLSEGTLVGVLCLAMLGSWFTDVIGIYAVFGAFILGCAMPRGTFAAELQRKIEPLTVALLLPLFFTYSGLNTRLDLVNTPWLWFVALVVLVAACLGKGAACWAAARMHGEDNRTALAVGTLMNARGLMELIILNIGLERGVITPALFSIMVVMAIVTTLMASPVFEWAYGAHARATGLIPARR
jgi:Kef-type K+ transport system membrane component KefB